MHGQRRHAFWGGGAGAFGPLGGLRPPGGAFGPPRGHCEVRLTIAWGSVHVGNEAWQFERGARGNRRPKAFGPRPPSQNARLTRPMWTEPHAIVRRTSQWPLGGRRPPPRGPKAP